jgi:hypothetical protein
MKRHVSGVAVALMVLTLPVGKADPSQTGGAIAATDVGRRLMEIAQGYSCSPKLTCGRISSCEEARWLLTNCSWGGKLDRDGDGVPCEDIC